MEPKDTGMDLSYILNELGEDRAQYFNAVSPPIIQTSNFTVKRWKICADCSKDEYSGYLYSRGLNPTLDILRKETGSAGWRRRRTRLQQRRVRHSLFRDGECEIGRSYRFC
jgi:hypothetical protein